MPKSGERTLKRKESTGTFNRERARTHIKELAKNVHRLQSCNDSVRQTNNTLIQLLATYGVIYTEKPASTTMVNHGTSIHDESCLMVLPRMHSNAQQLRFMATRSHRDTTGITAGMSHDIYPRVSQNATVISSNYNTLQNVVKDNLERQHQHKQEEAVISSMLTKMISAGMHSQGEHQGKQEEAAISSMLTRVTKSQVLQDAIAALIKSSSLCDRKSSHNSFLQQSMHDNCGWNERDMHKKAVEASILSKLGHPSSTINPYF